MNDETNVSRRFALASIGVMAANAALSKSAKAQDQFFDNDQQIVSTGDVYAEQAVSSTQIVEIAPGVYEDSYGNQVIMNDQHIVSTGDVYASQAVNASQEVDLDYDPITGGRGCDSGSVRFDLGIGKLIYCNDNCEWFVVPCNACQPVDDCKKGRCR